MTHRISSVSLAFIAALMAVVFAWSRPVSAATTAVATPHIVSAVTSTKVTVTGTGFGVQQKNFRVWIGQVPVAAEEIQSWTDTSIVLNLSTAVASVPMPARLSVGPSASAPVANGPIMYLQPIIESVASDSRVAPDMTSPGSTVTITGKYFTTQTGKVLFNTLEGTIVSWSPTKIQVQVPTWAVSGPVTVSVYDNNVAWYAVNVTSTTSLTILPIISNDPLGPENMWSLNTVQAQAGWNAVSSHPVTVAVIDSGIDVNHFDLTQSIWTNTHEATGDNQDNDHNGYVDDTHGWNFLKHSNDLTPTSDHGTAVAGIIGASVNNQAGVAGIAPHVRLMSLIAVGPHGATFDAVTQAMKYATQNGADIIVLGFNDAALNDSYSAAYDQAIADAYNAGVTIVAAAGRADLVTNRVPHNLNVSPISLACNGRGAQRMLLGVAATDRYDHKASFSDYGSTCVDVVAPGEDILTTIRTQSDPAWRQGYNPAMTGYALMSGTSMAAAAVAGEAAVLKSEYPTANNRQIMDIIRRSADSVDGVNPLFAGQLGAGRINIDRAIRLFPDPALARVPRVLGTETTRPTMVGMKGNNGRYSWHDGKKVISVQPITGFRGAMFSRTISFGDSTWHLFVPTAATPNGAIYLYDQHGKRVSVTMPFGTWSTRGLSISAVVMTSNDKVLLAVADIGSGKTVKIIEVTPRGLRMVQTITPSRGATTVQFLSLYSDEYGLVTAVAGQSKTLAVWKFSSTKQKFIRDGGYNVKKLVLNGSRILRP